MKTETQTKIYYDKVVNLTTSTLLEKLLDEDKKMKNVIISILGDDDKDDVKMLKRDVKEKLYKLIDLLK